MNRAKKLSTILIPLAILCLPLSASGKVVILDYHSFLGSGKSGLDYSEKELDAELGAITAMGYKFVNLDDAVAGRIEGVANIVVTIDDGNHSVYGAVKDVFERRGIKPYLFIYPAAILVHSRYALSPEQIKLLEEDGCGVGAHGFHHIPVTVREWMKSSKDFEAEIDRPGPALARMLGSRPSMFAYPYGVYSRRAEEEVAAAGYSWAFAADDRVRQVSFDDPKLDRMAVPRTITYRYKRSELLRTLKRFLNYDGPPLFEAAALLAPPKENLPGVVAR
jgi:poly-beta-1,6-N-acetyl-D-glucosamine N-deacetylase